MGRGAVGRLVALFLIGALAADPARGEGVSERALDALDAPAYARREAATRRLMRRSGIGHQQLRAAYARARTPEQRHRLARVAKHHFFRRRQREAAGADGRGAVGVSTVDLPVGPDRPGQVAVLVIRTFPGFPGHAHLYPGDRIRSVTGTRVMGPGAGKRFREAVAAHEPGESLRLEIRRGDARQRVTFELGRLEALEALYRGDGSVRAPWRDRWRRARAKIVDPPATAPSPESAD